MTDLAPYAPPTTATVEPVKFLDMTGVSEDVLWAIGRASRMGQLVRVEDHAERPDGTVRARIAYTGETPQMPATALALPGPARPAASAPLPDEPQRWEAWDYIMAGLIATVVAMAGAALWGLYLAVMALGAWVAAHSAQIVGTLAIIAVIMLLALLGGGKACPGLHCGGCRG